MNRLRAYTSFYQHPLTVMLLAVMLFSTFPALVYSQSAHSAEQADKKLGLTADGGQWGFHEVANPDSSLPNVLLIGDSIVQGYRTEVSSQLQGQANVDCLVIPTTVGSLKQLEEELNHALSYGRYTVIHFNDMGLHAWQKGRIPEGKYEPLLRAYVEFLQKHSQGATLIWTSTTPITVKGEPTELDPNNATIVERNAIAARIMKDLGIQTDDLYQLMITRLSMARGDRFHWTSAGEALQGRQVSRSISVALHSHLTRSSLK